jgi:hypothetical protein
VGCGRQPLALPALKLTIDAVHRYDSYVVQSTGDGIFALSSASVAHEDHPKPALYAPLRTSGLLMLERLTNRQERHSSCHAMRRYFSAQQPYFEGLFA